MPQATYLTLEEAARKYDVAEKVLTQLIAAGMIETHETPTGDVFVVADKNENGQEPQTKEEIIAAKFAHLQEQLISASEASRKYGRLHGIPIAHQTFSRWAKAGVINAKFDGYRLQMREADVAYCAEVYAQKYREYSGRMSGARIFDEDGNPYRLKYPEVAEQLRHERRQSRQSN
jgi:hypothetical protein